MDDKNATVRSNVAFALGELQAKVAVPKLIRLLKDEDQWVRKSAAKALGILRAKEAVAALQSLSSDPSDQVQRNAVRSLKQIEEGAKRCSRSVTASEGLITIKCEEQRPLFMTGGVAVFMKRLKADVVNGHSSYTCRSQNRS